MGKSIENARPVAQPRFASRRLRRRVLLAAAVVGAGLGVVRFGGYRAMGELAILTDPQAQLVSAGAEALLPHADEQARAAIVSAVDRYLVAMPSPTQREVVAAFALIEHLTPISGKLARFTSLSLEARREVLDALAKRDDVLGDCYGALRELCMLGYYQQPSSWPALGYAGPRMPPSRPPGDPERIAWPAYDALRAPADATPKAAS